MSIVAERKLLALQRDEPLAGNYFVAAYPPFSAWEVKQAPACERIFKQRASASPLGIYVHLPFCQKKCDYCYYLSYINQNAAAVNHYLETVVHEMELYAQQPAVKGRPVSFVYFGGGTPSTLSSSQVRFLTNGLRNALSWDGIEEITFECAPRSVRREFLKTLRAVGVTRLSMGVQSFDDELLQTNGRVHLLEDVCRAYPLISDAEFDSVNLDLMVGMLGETPEKWIQTVDRILQLSPDSVTIYQTEIPHNTKLYNDLKNGQLPAPVVPWEIKRARLCYAFNELERAGYTVNSAYSAVKNPSRQRFQYQEHLWRGDDMLPLGVAAFGYFNGFHFQNEVTLETYEAKVDANILPLKRALELTPQNQLVREFVLQLKWGAVSAAPFQKKFGVNIFEFFQEPLRRLAREGFLVCSEKEVLLTRAGLLRADRLLPEFYEAQYRNVRYT